MIKNLLCGIARKRAPDMRSQEQYRWDLFKLKRFSIAVCLQVRSQVYERTAAQSEWMWIFSGGIVMKAESDDFRAERGWLYADSDGRMMEALHMQPHDGFLAPRNSVYQIELYPAKTFGEKLLKLPWMSIDEMRDDTEAQCWFVRVAWGGP